MSETCAVCACKLYRGPGYATPTIHGRSHATKHHYIAERFFGRSANRRGEQREPIFKECPWGFEGETEVFCYECHEELLHNPVFLPIDIRAFAELVKLRKLDEVEKKVDREKLAGRITLLHDVLEQGIQVLLATEKKEK